ncbi:hypothetical protein HDU83_005028 [Entophlyctis luteolus]|nr:hypothetical protein HDU83_005028 [Entophlyctis luteolus]
MPCKQSFASIELFQKHIRDAHHTPVAEVASTNNNKPGSTISQSQTVLGSEYGAQSTSGRPHIVYDGHSREAVPQQQNSDSDRHLISTHSTSFSASVRRRDGIGVLAEAAEVEMRKQQMRELQKSEADAVKVQPIPDEDDDAFDDDDGDVDDGDDEDYDATASGRPEIFVKKNLH